MKVTEQQLQFLKSLVSGMPVSQLTRSGFKQLDAIEAKLTGLELDLDDADKAVLKGCLGVQCKTVYEIDALLSAKG